MKALSAVLLLAACLACATPLRAQVFYQFPDAPTIEPHRADAGAYMSGGDNLFRIGGYGRLGFARYWDVGFEIVGESYDSSWKAGAGGDLRYQLFPDTDKLPFDLTGDAGFGFATGDGVTLYQAPVGAVVSSPLKTDGGTMIIPYLGVYAVYVRTEVDIGSSTSADDDIEAMLRGGASLFVGERIQIYGTLQIGPNDLASIGINYSL